MNRCNRLLFHMRFMPRAVISAVEDSLEERTLFLLLPRHAAKRPNKIRMIVITMTKPINVAAKHEIQSIMKPATARLSEVVGFTVEVNPYDDVDEEFDG